MRKIEIIPLAKKKLRRRGISEQWVKQTLQEPGQIVEGYGGRKVAQKRYLAEGKEYLLRVVYEEIGESCIVLTAYLTSQVGRYWKEDLHED